MYMDSIATVTTNSFTMVMPYVETPWFAVRSRGTTTGAVGKRCYAFQKSPVLFNCTLSTDAATDKLFELLNTDCSAFGMETVSIKLDNNGTDTLINVPVRYNVNNGLSVAETYTDTILPGASAVYNFTTPVDLSVAANYTLRAWAEYAGDQNIYNDTAYTQVDSLSYFPKTIPYAETFEGFPLCGTDVGCTTIECALNDSWRNDPNTFDDDTEWRPNTGTTPSAGTGPDEDFIPGNSTGTYLYIEGSSCALSTAQLVTPCIDLTGTTNPIMEFAYHMYGPTMGSLHIDICSGGVWTNDVIPAFSGNLGEEWLTAMVDLTPYVGQSIRMRFRGSTGISSSSDMAIDAVGFREMNGVEEISTIGFYNVYPNPSTGEYTVVVGNTGQETQVLVRDAIGREIHSEIIRASSTSTSFNISNCPNGIYFLELKKGEMHEFVKLIKGN